MFTVREGAGHAQRDGVGPFTAPCSWGLGGVEVWTQGACITFLLLLGVGLEKHEKKRQVLGKGQVQRREDQNSSTVFACPSCLPKARGKLTGSQSTKPISSNKLEPAVILEFSLGTVGGGGGLTSFLTRSTAGLLGPDKACVCPALCPLPPLPLGTPTSPFLVYIRICNSLLVLPVKAEIGRQNLWQQGLENCLQFPHVWQRE